VLADEPLCGIYAMTVDLNAQALVATLRASMKPDAPGYIGAPPAEIAKLVDDTLEAAQDLDDAITDEGSVKDGVGSAGSRAASFVDRWEPYI
jgi:hypothetical protein